MIKYIHNSHTNQTGMSLRDQPVWNHKEKWRSHGNKWLYVQVHYSQNNPKGYVRWKTFYFTVKSIYHSPCSSAGEHPAEDRVVVGSNPTGGTELVNTSSSDISTWKSQSSSEKPDIMRFRTLTKDFRWTWWETDFRLKSLLKNTNTL